MCIHRAMSNIIYELPGKFKLVLWLHSFVGGAIGLRTLVCLVFYHHISAFFLFVNKGL
jgi:hypothetical protein